MSSCMLMRIDAFARRYGHTRVNEIHAPSPLEAKRDTQSAQLRGYAVIRKAYLRTLTSPTPVTSHAFGPRAKRNEVGN